MKSGLLVLLVMAVGRMWAQAPVPVPEEPATIRKTETKDPGRPVLRRGGPATERRTEAGPERRPQENPAYKVIEVDEEGRAVESVVGRELKPEEALLEKAEQVAADYVERLPNFLVEQHVTRYKGEGLRPQWKKEDELRVEVMYNDGKEDYTNIRRNGRLLRKADPAETGTWSTGEFGSTLLMLLKANPAPVFKAAKVEEIGGVEAQVYDFTAHTVPGNWEIKFGRPARPAYQGRIWVEKETGLVWRIEMDSRQLPLASEVDKVELTIDYGWVEIAGQKHFLPVRSDNLSCYRESVTCRRNETFFRNYRRFGAESQVLQVESEITFGDEDPKKPKSRTTPPSLDPKKPD
ncbi:MAG: hypothetical protein M9913_09130 [Bryobacteraceae bacterium]|nr:hypothetical protein [Solibacteraceae bacterium]MCL4842779.1 hypothetical protein [Bryobacteraceae bacterium]MCO5351047.1 hypothetical protein [Bryobacteraceae bacterium]